MAWVNPKIDWTPADGVAETDLNRAEGNTLYLGKKDGYAVDTGAVNAYAVALTPAATTYFAGMIVRFLPINTNTGASTIDVNVLGTVAITRDGVAALTGGEIVAGQVASLIHDGTSFQLMFTNLIVGLDDYKRLIRCGGTA